MAQTAHILMLLVFVPKADIANGSQSGFFPVVPRSGLRTLHTHCLSIRLYSLIALVCELQSVGHMLEMKAVWLPTAW